MELQATYTCSSYPQGLHTIFIYLLLLQSCHEGQCPFLLTECPACKGLIRLSEKEHHTEQECPKRSLSCQHCKAPCSREDLEVRWAGTAWVAVSITWAFS